MLEPPSGTLEAMLGMQGDETDRANISDVVDEPCVKRPDEQIVE